MLRFLKNKPILLIIITVAILATIGVSRMKENKINYVDNALSVIISPLQKLISLSGRKADDVFSYFKNTGKIMKENESLKDKIDRLENENRELIKYREQNKELRDVLNLRDQFSNYDMVGCNIIAKDLGNWFDVFVIDRGSKDGISSDFPVITSKGLVGCVLVADAFSSKVISIIDEGSTVSGRISKTGEYVVVRGDITLKDKGLCKVDYIPLDADVNVDDTIETSGIDGGKYPKGLVIGKIKEVRQSGNELYKYAIIQPVVDFKRIEEVFVLINNTR